MSAPRSSQLIAFVSNSAWSVFNFRLDVIRALIQKGHQVLVIAPADEYVEDLEKAGCRYVPIVLNNKTLSPVADLVFYQRLKRIYRDQKPDFIFHYVAKPNIYGSLAAAAVNIPSIAVITGLGYPFAKKNWLFTLMSLLYRIALRKSREVWFLNNDDAKVFVTEKIVSIDKVRVMPGEGINTQHFAPDVQRVKRDAFTFIMSTRLLKSKGILIYTDAARILRKKNYRLKFILLGFFEDHHPDSITRADITRWQNEKLIDYKGYARDVRPFLSAADCFVFPSFYNEGIPRCLMEASAMQLPVITSAVRGCRDVVLNNHSGYLCKARDPFDLADKMEKMINLSQTDRQKMGSAGRAYVVEKFDMQRIIEEYFTSLNIEPTD